MLDDSKFLNGLIARKSFSWTRVFMQLEQIMPSGLHVVSIQPSLSPKTDTVEVHMSVAGTARDAAVELVKRLEQSPSFRDARIEEETTIKPEKGTTDTVQFHLMAVYVPQPVSAAGAQADAAKVETTEAKAPKTPAGKTAGIKVTGARLAEAKGGTP